MKRAYCVLVAAFVLFAAAGCDLADLLSNAKLASAAQGVNPVAIPDQRRTEQHLRLMDGSCAGEGNHYQSQYATSGSGQGDRQQLRLRNGSCGDGNGG